MHRYCCFLVLTLLAPAVLFCQLLTTARDSAEVVKVASPGLMQKIKRGNGKNLQIIVYRHNGQLIKRSISRSMAALKSIVQEDSTDFIEVDRKPHEELMVPYWDLVTNNITAVQSIFPTIKGASVRISLKEDRFDSADVDLRGRIIASPHGSPQTSQHATIMATIIAGAGNSYLSGKGVAPLSRLSSSDYLRLSPDSSIWLKNQSIQIQNHSYGVGIENYYGIEAMEYDTQTNLDSSVCHVFSSGNLGDQTAPNGTYSSIPSFANLSGTFKQAKNVLVIGSTDAQSIVNNISSKGPAYDGRVKPDLVASAGDGTSGAAALTSGVCALLVEVFRLKNSTTAPSALVRSVLVSSADAVKGNEVSFLGGFGSVNALNAIRIIQAGQYFLSSLKPDSVIKYSLNIPANTGRLAVSLCWNDLPGKLNTLKSIVNNLDLYLTDSNGDTIRPWVLNTFPDVDSLTKKPLRCRDSINTVEKLTIDFPSQGRYIIHIAGSNIIGNQSFAISWHLEPRNFFEWTRPLERGQLVAGEHNRLRWQTNFAGRASLFYSTDSGQRWQPITDSLEISEGRFNWQSPLLFTEMQLAIHYNDKKFISPVFTVSPSLALTTSLNCADKSLLTWKRQPDSEFYSIYSLRTDTLKIYMSTRDTFLYLPAADLTTPYWAVSTSGSVFSGIRSPLINIHQQNTGCYVNSLLGVFIQDSGIVLNLNLSFSIDLKSITWQQLTKTGFVDIGSTPLNGVCCYRFLDVAKSQGTYYYRVILNKNDGSSITSDITPVYVVYNDSFLLYPNPFRDKFFVATHNVGRYELRLFDITGKQVYHTFLQSFSHQSSLAHLSSGLYFYTISSKTSVVQKGKLIKY